MGRHEGRAFHPTLPGGQQGGELNVSLSGVAWQGESGRIELPVHGLHLELGGASDRVVFFTHPGCDGWALTTTDLSVLQDDALLALPAAAELVRRAKRKRRVGAWISWGLVAAVVAALASLVIFRGVLVRAAASQVPVSVESAMGEAAAAGIGASMGHPVIEDGDADAALAELTAPLLKGIGPTRYEYRFHILDDASVNAFALPGGQVFVHSGLILRADRPEEVAGVLAHEIAHVQERHSLRALIERLGLSVLAQLVIGDASGIQGVLVSSAPELIGLKFSRDFEREADETGFRYLVRSGMDPTGMASMFRKLKDDEEAGMGALAGVSDAMSLLSTHPAAQERFDRLDEMAAERAGAPPPAKLDVDFGAFQERIRGLAHAGP